MRFYSILAIVLLISIAAAVEYEQTIQITVMKGADTIGAATATPAPSTSHDSDSTKIVYQTPPGLLVNDELALAVIISIFAVFLAAAVIVYTKHTGKKFTVFDWPKNKPLNLYPSDLREYLGDVLNKSWNNNTDEIRKNAVQGNIVIQPRNPLLEIPDPDKVTKNDFDRRNI